MMPTTTSASLMSLSEELILYILEYVTDFDLQSLSKVSPKLRRLSSDMVLWKHFRMVRNASMIRGRLFINSRPDRLDLVRNNVMKGVSSHQLQAGEYINGPSQRTMHEQQAKLAWLMREVSINRRLHSRPDVSTLAERGVLTEETSSCKSPVLAARSKHLKRVLQQAVLYRKLQKRQSSDEGIPSYVKGRTQGLARSLVATKLELEKHFAEHNLQKLIVNRPGLQAVENQIDDRGMALMVCPGVRPKIRQYEVMTSSVSSIEEKQLANDLNSNLRSYRCTWLEQARTQQRELRSVTRNLEREDAQLNKQENQLEAEIKKAAKAGNAAAAKSLAKQLIKVRSMKQKNLSVKAQVSGVSHQTQAMASNVAIATAMKGTTKIMASSNKAMNIQKVQQTMQDFEKQNMVMDMKEDMMNDAMDSVMDEEDDEEETDNIMNSIFEEIGLEISTKASSVPTKLPQRAQAEEDSEQSSVEARLAALRSI